MWHMYQLDELLYQSFNMSDKDKMRLYRWIFATSMQWMNRRSIFFNLHTPYEMTQQRTLSFAENFTTHQEFRLRETTIRGMSIQIFLFFLSNICTYVYIHIMYCLSKNHLHLLKVVVFAVFNLLAWTSLGTKGAQVICKASHKHH